MQRHLAVRGEILTLNRKFHKYQNLTKMEIVKIPLQILLNCKIFIVIFILKL